MLIMACAKFHKAGQPHISLPFHQGRIAVKSLILGRASFCNVSAVPEELIEVLMTSLDGDPEEYPNALTSLLGTYNHVPAELALKPVAPGKTSQN